MTNVVPAETLSVRGRIVEVLCKTFQMKRASARGAS